MLFELTAEVECTLCPREFFHWSGAWSMWCDSLEDSRGTSRQLICAECAVQHESIPLWEWDALSTMGQHRWMAVVELAQHRG